MTQGSQTRESQTQGSQTRESQTQRSQTGESPPGSETLGSGKTQESQTRGSQTQKSQTGGFQTQGSQTRASGNPFKAHRDGDRLLQLLIFNEEFLVSASHQLVLITSLPFVHTARRSYRLSDPVNNSDCSSVRFLNVAAESLVNLIT